MVGRGEESVAFPFGDVHPPVLLLVVSDEGAVLFRRLGQPIRNNFRIFLVKETSHGVPEFKILWLPSTARSPSTWSTLSDRNSTRREIKIHDICRI